MTNEFFRCDSCKKLFPKETMTKIKFDYNTYNSNSKEDLSTETMYGMVCLNCSAASPTSTKSSTKASTSYPRKK